LLIFIACHLPGMGPSIPSFSRFPGLRLEFSLLEQGRDHKRDKQEQVENQKANAEDIRDVFHEPPGFVAD